MHKAVIIIAPDATVRHLVDPVSERIAAAIGPKISTQRSSHVETWHDLAPGARRYILEYLPVFADVPGDNIFSLNDSENLTNHFWADMLPVAGPVLGPFEKHENAIEAEIRYLQEQNLPCALGAPIDGTNYDNE